MKEETYSYKTPSAQLVKIAEIASQYKGRPEMLMKVIIKSQKIVTAFSAIGGSSDCQRNGYPADTSI